jgi:hypothetical protein
MGIVSYASNIRWLTCLPSKADAGTHIIILLTQMSYCATVASHLVDAFALKLYCV